MPADLDEIAYWLQQIATPDVWRDYVLPSLGIGATLLLGWGAIRAARAANTIAAQNIELAMRAERRRFAEAVIAYYESRHEDVRQGKNWNMPHWNELAQAVGTEIGEPNSDRLLGWVEAAIEHAAGSDVSQSDRHLNAMHLHASLPMVAARWVNDPASFAETPFKLWHEQHANSVVAPGAE